MKKKPFFITFSFLLILVILLSTALIAHEQGGMFGGCACGGPIPINVCVGDGGVGCMLGGILGICGHNDGLCDWQYVIPCANEPTCPNE